MVQATVMLNAPNLIHTLKMVNLDLAVLKWIYGKPIKWLIPLLHILAQVREISNAKVLCVANLIDIMVFVTWMDVDLIHIH